MMMRAGGAGSRRGRQGRGDKSGGHTLLPTPQRHQNHHTSNPFKSVHIRSNLFKHSNSNVVYLSYLDSVKYFRPEGVSAAAASGGASLRTFVYHQVILGYVDFVRSLGFEKMLIWACPPLQGDDYILYCHPSRQKVPRSDRLRHWYLDMLKEARREGSVAGVSTLFDSFFEGGRCAFFVLGFWLGSGWLSVVLAFTAFSSRV